MNKHRLKTAAVIAACLMTTGCSSLYNTGNSRAELKKDYSTVQPGQSTNPISSGLYPSTPQYTPTGKNPQESAATQKEQKASAVSYIVNGAPFTANVYSDEEAMTLCNTLMDYAEEGKHVAVGCETAQDTLAQNMVITFSSTSRVEVTYWVSNMIRRGYAVTIDYEKKTGVYNCTAYRKVTP